MQANNFLFQHVVVPTMAELYQYISEDELTHEFGGSLQYKHQDWVRFRMVSLSHFCYICPPFLLFSLCSKLSHSFVM